MQIDFRSNEANIDLTERICTEELSLLADNKQEIKFLGILHNSIQQSANPKKLGITSRLGTHPDFLEIKHRFQI